jgi:cytochrome P450
MAAYQDDREIVFTPVNPRGKGNWVFKSYDIVAEALKMTELFSSDRYSGFSQLIGEDWPMLPLEVDPPLHRPYRLLLNKVFAPSRMSALEDGITETVRNLLDKIRPLGKCEFQQSFGLPLPTTMFLRLMDLPLEDAPTLLAWENELLHGMDMAARASAARSIKDYLVGYIEKREQAPADDVVSYIAQAELDGRPLTSLEKLGMCFVLYGAGLDTVASALGFTFKYLAENPDKQEQLRRRPEIRERAVEELLRANTNVVPNRIVTRDTDFHGVSLKKGDVVALPTMFANHDPALFECPAGVDFDRGNVMRHVSFGSGPHNCLGSHLARRELRIALDEWMNGMPPFRLGEESPVTYGGSVFGVHSLHLAWDN